MRRKGYIPAQFGPLVPIVPRDDFTIFRFEREQLERAWEIIGPSAIKNLHVCRADQLWKVITFAYLEGLHHGSEIERKNDRTD